MATLVYAASFDHGTTTGLGNGGATHEYWSSVIGTVTIVSGAARTGGFGLRTPLNGQHCAVIDLNVVGTTQVQVGSFYFKLSTEPTTDTCIFAISTTAAPGICELFYRPSVDALRWKHDSVAAGSDSSGHSAIVGTTNWYRLDYRINSSANPWTIDYSIDGVAQTAYQPAVASTNIVETLIGSQQAGTGQCDYDDLVLSNTSGDYPIGDHKVVMLVPDAVSASDGGTDFRSFTANGTLEAWNNATALSRIDEVPPVFGASADGICQITNDTANYMAVEMSEYTIASNETVLGARMIAPGWATSGTAATIEFRSYNGTTERTLFSVADPAFDNATTTAWVCKMLTVADIAAQADLDALVFRIGFSNDAAPDIGVHSVYCDVAIAIGAPDTDVDAENALGVGASNNASASVKVNAGVATATATSNDADGLPGTRAIAGNATAAGTSNNVTTLIVTGAGNALGAGTANVSAASLGVPAGNALGTATANDATVSTAVATNAPAENALGVGTANNVTTLIVVNAGVATGVATANDIDPNVGATTQLASGAGVSNGVTTSISATSGSAGASAAANDIDSKVSVNAGTTLGSGVANQPLASIKVNAGVATGVGTSNVADGLPGAQALAQAATATSTVNSATTKISATTSTATGTGTANDAIAATGSNTFAQAGVATAVGSVGNVTSKITTAAGLATATAVSNGVSASVKASANVAAGVGTSNISSASVKAMTQAATGVSTANNSTVTTTENTTVFAEVALATSTSNGVSGMVAATVGAALAIATAYNTSTIVPEIPPPDITISRRSDAVQIARQLNQVVAGLKTDSVIIKRRNP